MQIRLKNKSGAIIGRYRQVKSWELPKPGRRKDQTWVEVLYNDGAVSAQVLNEADLPVTVQKIYGQDEQEYFREIR